MISLLVPFRPGDPVRDRLWRHVKGLWRAAAPDWELIWASDDPDGPWRKGVAVQRALNASTGEIVAVIDADTWIPGVFEAVERVQSGQTWVRSHHQVLRLTQEATEKVLQGAHISLVGGYPENLVDPPYTQTAAGAGTVCLRSVIEDVPIDCRFAGWGGEDSAWADALTTFYGPASRVNDFCYHLWHPPAPRIAPKIGSDLSNQLRIRYKQAFRNKEATRVHVEAGRYHSRHFDVV